MEDNTINMDTKGTTITLKEGFTIHLNTVKFTIHLPDGNPITLTELVDGYLENKGEEV